jgi:hypothetical protein
MDIKVLRWCIVKWFIMIDFVIITDWYDSEDCGEMITVYKKK